jgi:hypothetical protein
MMVAPLLTMKLVIVKCIPETPLVVEDRGHLEVAATIEGWLQSLSDWQLHGCRDMSAQLGRC